ITGAGRINSKAIGRTGPGKQSASQILLPSASPHALRNQTPFILGNGPTDLQQELIMGIVAHGSIHKFHPTAASFKFFNEKHLMDIVTSEPVRGRDDDSIKDRTSYLFP